MKNLLLSVCCFLGFFSKGQNTPPSFEVKYSPVLSLLRYSEAASKVSHYSPTYRKLILEKIGENNNDFKTLVADFQSIRMDYNFEWDQYPRSRHSERTTYDLVNIAAVNAEDLDDFGRRIIGLLPNDDMIHFINCLKKMKPYHDQFLEGYEKKVKKQIKLYKPYKKKLSFLFSKASSFYGTKWSENIPFVVSLYPIPGKSGATSATPHGNTLVCAILADREKDYLSRLSIVTHEMCHILYDCQSAEKQVNIEKWMKNNTSKYRNLAYQYFDEGMATAIGNGWAFEVLNNRIDTTEWYADEIINQYGHGLFPLVKSYLRAGKEIDSLFVDEAIQIFEKNFPKSINDYNVLMNEVFVTGSFPDAELNNVMQVFRDNFRISSSSLSTPLMDAQVAQDLKTSKAAVKIFLFNEDLKKNWEYLKENQPAIAQKFGDVVGTPTTGQYFAFIGDDGQAYIILFYDDLKMLSKMIKQIKNDRYMSPEQPIKEVKN
jgi:hypothetical protein